MADESALGVDLGRDPWRAALADGDHVELLPTPADLSIAALVQTFVEQHGTRPSRVVVSVPQSVDAQLVRLDIARQLGIDPDRVTAIDDVAAAALGTEFLGIGGRDALGSQDDRQASVVAIGAALDGLASQRRWNATVLAAGTAAGVAGVAGAAGASAFAGAAAGAAPAVGPSGVPVSGGASMGPTGVAIDGSAAGPTGVPMGHAPPMGPSGAPMSGGGVGPAGVPMGGIPPSGPAGTPLARAGATVRRHPLAAIAGGVLLATVAVGTVVVASGGDDATGTTDVPVQSALVVEQDVVPSTATATTIQPAPDTTLAPAVTTIAPTTSALITELAGAACVVGSWAADDDALAAGFQHAFEGLGGGELHVIGGTVNVSIAADATFVTTYDNWTMEMVIPGAGTGTITVNGVDSSTVTFGDDGSYSVSNTQIGSTMRVAAGGIALLDGPSPDTMMQGANTYTCNGDRLEIDVTAQVGYLATFTRDG
jgi:hypothetical protein